MPNNVVNGSIAIIPQKSLNKANHNPICIESDGQFNFTNGVVSGSGTANKPYIIEGWDINAKNTTGIKIKNTTAYFTVRNCSVHDGGWYAYSSGVFVANSTNGRIEYCTISGNDFAMQFDNPTLNMTITHNYIMNNYYGIFLYTAKNSTLSYNSITSTQGNAIVLSNYCGHNNISHNSIISNYFNGIWLSSHSDNNTISYNNVSNCFRYAVSIADSHFNRIHHNTFISNHESSGTRDPAHIQANDSAGSNFWNESAEGNYWADWTSPDTQIPYGIVDEPYEMDGAMGVVDQLPLTTPVQDAGAVPELYNSPSVIVIVSLLLTIIAYAGVRSTKKI